MNKESESSDNIYFNLFKSQCFCLKAPLKFDSIQILITNISLIHNTMGLAFMELIKVVGILSKLVLEEKSIENQPEKLEEKKINIDSKIKIHSKQTKETKKSKSTEIIEINENEIPSEELQPNQTNIEINLNQLKYTKNFKKKKLNDIENSNLLTKRIKNDENLFYESKKKDLKIFQINKPETIELSQPNDLQRKKEKEEKNNLSIIREAEFIYNTSLGENIPDNKQNFEKSPNNKTCDPFRQNFRKKEDRANLTGFACDQCDKFYKALQMGSNILDADKFCKCFSRHKDIYELPQTPEIFYNDDGFHFEKKTSEK